MELCGIGTTRRLRPVEAITPRTLENRVKWSITIDPIVGSFLNFFNEFPEAIFDEVAWNRYDKPDGVRSRQFHRQRKRTGSKGP